MNKEIHGKTKANLYFLKINLSGGLILMTEYEETVPQMGYFISRSCMPNWAIGETMIDFIDLTYIVAGKATYLIDGQPYDVEQGDLICIPKNSRRAAITDSRNPMVNFAANFQFYDLKGEDAKLPFPVVSKVGVHDELISLYKELSVEWLRKSPGYKMKVHGIFLSILHHYFTMIYYKSYSAPIDSRIQKALTYIHKNYVNSITLDDLANLSGLNSIYFGTLFKKCTGVSVKRYITQVRINHSEKMLLSGEFMVSEVALKCGFEDMFYFSKVFKKVKGFSPSKITTLKKPYQ
jgi:AraC-like DNA-binding protein